MAKDQEINIYRIVQEAVNNSIKHGRATRLGISTSINQNQFFCITISDNGHGNELLNQFPMNISVGGVGLRSMEYRTHQLQGKLSIQSHVNEGTIVSICIPLNKRD
jgi:two-component system sensor histidine kinase DegS